MVQLEPLEEHLVPLHGLQSRLVQALVSKTKRIKKIRCGPCLNEVFYVYLHERKNSATSVDIMSVYEFC